MTLSTWHYKPYYGPFESFSNKCPWSILPRKKLDLSYMDLCNALYSVICQDDIHRNSILKTISSTWQNNDDNEPTNKNILTCLSVRTAFDLFLQLQAFPPQSEILVSAITIPDMIFLIKAFDCIPVPIDLEQDTCAMKLDLLQKAITKNTKAVLIAHVFGTQNDISSYVECIHAAETHLGNKIYIIEDCAQAYSGVHRFQGHLDSDLVLFSFGTIKTSTALGGAVACIKDKELYAKMVTLNDTYPIRSRWVYGTKVLKYAIVHGLSTPAFFGALVRMCWILHIHFDDLITSAIRGFSGGKLQDLIRYRPSVPLLSLLARRLTKKKHVYLLARRQVSERLYHLLHDEILKNHTVVKVPGHAARDHWYWLFPLQVPNPSQVASMLSAAGYDVTSGATQLTCVPVPKGYADRMEPAHVAAAIMNSIVYIPVTPECTEAVLKDMVFHIKKSCIPRSSL